MHVLAGRDVDLRGADDLVVAPHRLPGADGAHRVLLEVEAQLEQKGVQLSMGFVYGAAIDRMQPGLEAGVWMAIGLAVYPPVRLWKRLLGLWLRGDSLLGFQWVAVLFLLGGFVIDDILRPVQFVELGTKQLCEETSETIGALLYFIGMILHWRRPLDARLQ